MSDAYTPGPPYVHKPSTIPEVACNPHQVITGVAKCLGSQVSADLSLITDRPAMMGTSPDVGRPPGVVHGQY